MSNSYTKSFTNSETLTICPKCKSDLELDTTQEDNGYLGTLLCSNENCDYEEVYCFTTFEDAEDECEEYDDQEECEEYEENDSFTCPDCGRRFAPDDYENGDAGNGFCSHCASEH